MKYFIAASLLAAAVSAQSISDIPACALTCALTSLTKHQATFDKECGQGVVSTAKLASGDPAAAECLCKTSAFQADFSSCANGDTAKCDVDAKCALWDYSNETCNKFSVPLPDTLNPGGCPSDAAPAKSSTPAEPSQPAAAPPSEETTGAPAEETPSATAPAETSAPAENSGAAGAPPSYGSPTTVATAASSEAAAASGEPTYTPSSASTIVLSGAAALFAGFVAVLAL